MRSTTEFHTLLSVLESLMAADLAPEVCQEAASAAVAEFAGRVNHPAFEVAAQAILQRMREAPADTPAEPKTPTRRASGKAKA